MSFRHVCVCVVLATKPWFPLSLCLACVSLTGLPAPLDTVFEIKPLLGRAQLDWAGSSCRCSFEVVPWCKRSVYVFHTALAPAIGNLQCSLYGFGAPLVSIQNRRTCSSVVSPSTSANGGPICNLCTNVHVAIFEYHAWMPYHY